MTLLLYCRHEDAKKMICTSCLHSKYYNKFTALHTPIIKANRLKWLYL